MKEGKKYGEFTAADALRYHSGQMTVQEMHQLELAALDDPFLSDALDGYRHDPDAVKSLEQLRNQIPQKQESKLKPVVPIKRKKSNMLFRIAAILLVLAIPGYFLLKKKQSESKEVLAIEMKDLPLIRSIPDGSSLTDSADLAINEPNPEYNKTLNPTQQPSKNITNTNAGMPLDDIPSNAQTEVVSEQKETEKMEAPIAVRPYEKDQITNQNDKQLVITGKVTDRRGQAIPGAIISNQNNFAQTDASGNFRIPVKDSADFLVSATGYESKNLSNKERKETIVLEQDQQQLSEVVVTSADSRKVTKKSKSAASTNINAGDLERDQSIPAEGWASFQQYISRNKKQPQNKLLVPQFGAVVLQFKVNAKGRPEKIKVISSTCKSCEDEAKRLLREGPNWTYLNGKKTSWSIIF